MRLNKMIIMWNSFLENMKINEIKGNDEINTKRVLQKIGVSNEDSINIDDLFLKNYKSIVNIEFKKMLDEGYIPSKNVKEKVRNQIIFDLIRVNDSIYGDEKRFKNRVDHWNGPLKKDIKEIYYVMKKFDFVNIKFIEDVSNYLDSIDKKHGTTRLSVYLISKMITPMLLEMSPNYIDINNKYLTTTINNKENASYLEKKVLMARNPKFLLNPVFTIDRKHFKEQMVGKEGNEKYQATNSDILPFFELASSRVSSEYKYQFPQKERELGNFWFNVLNECIEKKELNLEKDFKIYLHSKSNGKKAFSLLMMFYYPEIVLPLLKQVDFEEIEKSEIFPAYYRSLNNANEELKKESIFNNLHDLWKNSVITKIIDENDFISYAKQINIPTRILQELENLNKNIIDLKEGKLSIESLNYLNNVNMEIVTVLNNIEELKVLDNDLFADAINNKFMITLDKIKSHINTIQIESLENKIGEMRASKTVAKNHTIK